MDAYRLDVLLRDFIAGVQRVIERQRNEPDLIPFLDAECRAAYRIRESMSADEFAWFRTHELLALRVNGRIDHGVTTGFTWLIGEAVEDDLDCAAVARDAIRLRGALLGGQP